MCPLFTYILPGFGFCCQHNKIIVCVVYIVCVYICVAYVVCVVCVCVYVCA